MENFKTVLLLLSKLIIIVRHQYDDYGDGGGFRSFILNFLKIRSITVL